MKATVSVSHELIRTPRVMQVEARFDLPADEKLARTWQVEAPIEDKDWNIGLIVGPSGAGKSTCAKAMFGDQLIGDLDWPYQGALVDAFAADLSVKDITATLNAVGLSTAPAWLRPFHTLSGGEQFRAHVARALLENPELAVIDEFTSTVDRQVAQIASAATSKLVRRRGSRMVAVTCHYDIEEWLQPDWVFQPHVPRFTWRQVQPRPTVTVDVRKVDASLWKVFRVHHYLSANMPAGDCYGAFVGDECVAFGVVAHFPHPSPKARRIRRLRRLVVMPDWQGLGIGTRFEEHLADLYVAKGYRFRSVTTHPGLIRYYLKSKRWHCDTRPGQMMLGGGKNAHKGLAKHQADPRMMNCYGFEYRPKAPVPASQASP
ncbi:GNAT family N-acetyltransferase [Streptomyces sp. cg35]|uniref:GNAT family N-acetyltransferase n=1 Tax=Streptomyces sp. cg35 TaxID=3421650 RepID=UPI003D178979